MMRFGSRPNSAKNEYEAQAAAHQAALDLLQVGGKPDYARINEYIDTKSYQIWGKVKPHFMAAQHRKCGFCEVKITEAPGDVEHYCPKNALWTLKSSGSELEDLVNASGRQFKKTHNSGYWWLTYSWDNYLLACGTCNQKWKSALFPLKGNRRRPPKRGDETNETPLLLDPFGDVEPTQHLAFDGFGQIEAYEDSKFGQKTIETCGLDRESLRSSREEKAIRAHRLMRDLLSASPDETKTILKDIHEMGNAEYVHAGMVRAIYEQVSDTTWLQLEERLATEFIF